MFSLVGRSDVVTSIMELSATHSNCFLYCGTRRQCVLNRSTLGNGIPGMMFSLVGLTDTVMSIVELSAILPVYLNGFLHCGTLWRCILKHGTLRTGLACMVASLVGRSDVVTSIVELSATHSNCLVSRGIRRQCILNHSTLGNGIPGMMFSLVGLSDMIVSIVTFRHALE